jgi:hypothetical protein
MVWNLGCGKEIERFTILLTDSGRNIKQIRPKRSQIPEGISTTQEGQEDILGMNDI